MKKVVIQGERDVAVVDVPTPHAVGDYALVKVLVTPMCTEYKAYRDGQRSEFLGHEAGGEVVEVAQPGRVKPGDRVVVMSQYPCGECDLCYQGDYIHCLSRKRFAEDTRQPEGSATYAQYLLKPSWLLPKIPESLSIEHASMACCGLGPTLGAVRRMGVSGHHTVLITGLGPVGLGGIINSTYAGARVIGVESQPYRAALARELGAETVVNPDEPGCLDRIRELTGGTGPDMGIDCSGALAAQRTLIDSVRRRGQVAFIGEGGELPIHVSNDLIRKGITLHGIWHYNRADIPLMFRVIERSRGLLDRMITHSFPMSRVREAFELQLTGNSGKVLLHPWD